METFTIRTDSGVVFEMRQARYGGGDVYVVTGSIGRQSVTAESMVGMDFMAGNNPLWWSRGYAQIIQRAVNDHASLATT